jgi:hypothetical protein
MATEGEILGHPELDEENEQRMAKSVGEMVEEDLDDPDTPTTFDHPVHELREGDAPG